MTSFPLLLESDTLSVPIALFMLLHLSQPQPYARHFQFDPPAVALIRSITAHFPEAHTLLNCIAAMSGLWYVIATNFKAFRRNEQHFISNIRPCAHAYPTLLPYAFLH